MRTAICHSSRKKGACGDARGQPLYCSRCRRFRRCCGRSDEWQHGLDGVGRRRLRARRLLTIHVLGKPTSMSNKRLVTCFPLLVVLQASLTYRRPQLPTSRNRSTARVSHLQPYHQHSHRLLSWPSSCSSPPAAIGIGFGFCFWGANVEEHSASSPSTATHICCFS